jgi:ribosome-binding factor A
MGSHDEAEQSLAALDHASRFFRRELGNSLALRYIPELHFRLDDSLERGLRIDQLLDSLHDDSTAGGDDAK